MPTKRKFTIDRAAIPRSYREYVERLKSLNEAIEINDEVDWNLEIGAILRHSYETVSEQPIFNMVKGSPGFRAAEYGPTRSRTPGKSWRRLAILLGLPEDATPIEMQDPFLEAKSGLPHPPKIVSSDSAPCKENKWFGDDVDLEKLPAPILHDGDNGRYLQTAGAIIVATPDKRWTNWSISRGKIVDKSSMTGLWLPFQHNGMIYRMWQKEGKDCPFAIAFGVPPVAMTQIASAPPEWHNEYDYASALLGEPLEMVKCETNDLLVPASSEIVIEGFVSATKESVEGPFGEYPGYLSSESHLAPNATVTCVTFRNNAILPITNPGVPVDSTHVNGAFFMCADAIVAFRAAGLPVIDGMYTFESASHWFVIRVRDDWHQITGLSVKDFVGKLADTYWTRHVGHGCSKLIIVGEDIPPDDPLKVTWAFATRNNPALGVYQFPQYELGEAGLQIYLDVSHKLRGEGRLVVYSCLQLEEQVNHPLEPVLSFELNYPFPLQERIRAKWRNWGFTS
jgi:UbiD family decarboxylase